MPKDGQQNAEKTVEGRGDHDYFFDIDIQSGSCPLKLRYKSSENPFESARSFTHNNHLPDAYVYQVVNFITTKLKRLMVTEMCC